MFPLGWVSCPVVLVVPSAPAAWLIRSGGLAETRAEADPARCFFFFTAADASSWLRKEQVSGVACVASGSTLSFTQRTLIGTRGETPNV